MWTFLPWDNSDFTNGNRRTTTYKPRPLREETRVQESNLLGWNSISWSCKTRPCRPSEAADFPSTIIFSLEEKMCWGLRQRRRFSVGSASLFRCGRGGQLLYCLRAAGSRRIFIPVWTRRAYRCGIYHRASKLHGSYFPWCFISVPIYSVSLRLWRPLRLIGQGE